MVEDKKVGKDESGRRERDKVGKKLNLSGIRVTRHYSNYMSRDRNPKKRRRRKNLTFFGKGAAK